MTSPADAPAVPPVSILLIGDECTRLLTLERILEGSGRRLLRALSAQQALEMLEQDDFAVVLLDFARSGLEALQTARLIRSRERSRQTPILFLTAAPGFPLVEAYGLGAVDCLARPVVQEILRAKIAMFVELFTRTRQLRVLTEQFHRASQEQTQRRSAEEALRASEELFRSAFEDTNVAMVLTDTSHRFVRVNAAFARLFGYSPQQLLGVAMADVTHPDHLAESYARRRPLESGAADYFQMEKRYLHRDGSVFWGLANVSAVRDEHGRVVQYVGQVQDITPRKRAEEEMREAGQRKDEFLAMLAHELRNPLATLTSALQALRRNGADPEVRRQSLERMDRQSRQLRRLVDDLLEASRLSHGKVHLVRERLDLARLTRTVAEDARPDLEAAGLSLEVRVPEIPVWVQGDATRLTQALSNLLENATRFSKAGGHIRVTVRADAEAGRANVSVEDTGVGIAREVLSRLFRPFEQADQGLARSQGGLGLGLAIVKQLIELHGGEVAASSAGPGQGATFAVGLPMEREPEALTETPRNPSVYGKPSRVLVVEDNADAADSLRLLLELYGHEVRVAHTGPEGVQAARQWLPEVVVSDIGLPGFDGYEVARRVRKMPGMERALLVALTGYGTEQDQHCAREAGFNLHFVKPAEPAALQLALALGCA